MLPELRRKPLITLGVRGLRVIRTLLAVMAILVIAEGAVLLVVDALPDFEGRSGIGLWLVLLGSAMGLYAWRGRWTPAITEEEKVRDERLKRRLDVLLGGVELLFLSFALLGLLVPLLFGGLWEEYRSSVTFFLALAAFDLALRLVRRQQRGKKAEDAR